MDLIIVAFLGLAGVLEATLARILSDEFKAWNPWIVERLIRLAERRLPEKHLDRLAEEWRSHVAEIPGDVGKILAACGFSLAATKIRRDAVTDFFKRATAFMMGRGSQILLAVLLAPLFLALLATLAIEQRRWPLVREKVKFLGREVTFLKFRTSLESGPFTRMVLATDLDELPILFDMGLGRPSRPLGQLMRRLFRVRK